MLGNLLKTVLPNASDSGQQQAGSGLSAAVIEMVTCQQTGGLQGLVQNLTSKGLGDVVSSWVGTGPNLPVSDSQIHSALGSQVINALAQKAGVAPDVASSMLAQALPGLIDKLTPDGKIPESGNLLERALSILKGATP